MPEALRFAALRKEATSPSAPPGSPHGFTAHACPHKTGTLPRSQPVPCLGDDFGSAHGKSTTQRQGAVRSATHFCFFVRKTTQLSLSCSGDAGMRLHHVHPTATATIRQIDAPTVKRTQGFLGDSWPGWSRLARSARYWWRTFATASTKMFASLFAHTLRVVQLRHLCAALVAGIRTGRCLLRFREHPA